MIETETLIGLDIETSNGFGQGSLDARDANSFIALMQFSFEDGEIRIMRANEGMKLLHELNKPNTRFIIHNAFFELDWFLHKYEFPIHTMKVWCPMTASQILNAGKNIPDKASWLSTKLNKKNNDYLGKWNPLIHEQDTNIEEAKAAKFTHNLQATVYRYADGVVIEKDQGNSDWASINLTDEQIRYAKDDVKYLIQVARNQWEFIKKFKMERVAQLEMSLIPATIDMKKNGMKIDTQKWEQAAVEYKQKAVVLEEKLNAIMGMELAKREGNVSLFGMVIPRAFNVSSASQVASYFNLPSADESHLRELVDEDPLIKDILEYKEYFKISSTYGKNYLKFLDLADGRIHSMLVQTETATGRYCISKGTMIEVIRDVSKNPKGIPIENVKVGDMVYTYDDNLNLTIKPVLWSGKTGNKKVIRLHWKGQGNRHVGFLDLTPEHRVRKSSGEYVQAKDLVVGDSVLALSRGPTNNYQRLWATGIGEIQKEHRFVYETLVKPIEPNSHVHHIDGNKSNNVLENLEVMTHASHTRKHARQNWKKNKEKMAKAARENIKIASVALREKYRDTPMPNSLNLEKEWMLKVLWENSGKPTAFRDIHGIDYETAKKYMKAHGIDYREIAKKFNGNGEVITRDGIEEARKVYEEKGQVSAQKKIALGYYRFKNAQAEFYPEEKIYNHKITKIEYLDESVDVYDLEVQDTHNFIANEICVHNSSRKPNLQNIPRDMLKGFITVDDNKVLLTVDYSSMESRILAYAAGDDRFIQAVNSEDVHWENAKNIFKLPKNATKKEVFYVDTFKKNLPGDELRRMAKGVSFGIPYGISALGLVGRGFAENEEQGQELIDGFLNQYPNVKKFLETAKAEGLYNGYTQDPFGRVRWHQKPKRGEAPDEEIKKIEASIARRSQNHKIQSMSANITKMALKDLYYYLKESQYGKMVLTIHDSIFFELNEETAEEAIPAILKIMEDAGPSVFDGMIVPADADVGVKETRRCVISGLEFSLYSHTYDGKKISRNEQFVETRVFSLLDGDIFDVVKSRRKLLDIISQKDDTWRGQNMDIVKAMLG